MSDRVESTRLALDEITQIVSPILANFKKEEVVVVNVPEDEATAITLLDVHGNLISKIAERACVQTILKGIHPGNTDLVTRRGKLAGRT